MNLERDLYRKCFHLLLLIIPITYHLIGKWKSLIIFAPLTLLLVAIDYSRKKNPKIKNAFNKAFGLILKDHEITGEKLCGASWVGLATCINFLIFKPSIAITAFVILAISDSAASLVGKSVSSPPFFEKSLAGSSAFFISALIILFGCGAFFNSGFSFYLFGIFAVFCVTMFEARPSLIGIDDNFSIPIGFSVIMTFFDLLWNYNY